MRTVRDYAFRPRFLADSAIQRWRSLGRATVVVEGHSDVKFFKSFINDRRVEVVEAAGKRGVLEAFELLQRETTAFTRFVVDLDRDHLSQVEYWEDERVVYVSEIAASSVHFSNDLECLLLRVGALRRIWDEYDSDFSYEQFTERLIDLGLHLACLREAAWPHCTNKEQLFQFDSILDSRHLEVMEEKVGGWIVGVPAQTISRIVTEAAALRIQRSISPWLYLRGHDLTYVAAKHFSNARSVHQLEIERMLRVATRWVDIAATPLGEVLASWKIPARGSEPEQSLISVQ